MLSILCRSVRHWYRCPTDYRRRRIPFRSAQTLWNRAANSLLAPIPRAHPLRQRRHRRRSIMFRPPPRGTPWFHFFLFFIPTNGHQTDEHQMMNRQCFSAKMAAMNNVLSAISESIIIAKEGHSMPLDWPSFRLLTGALSSLGSNCFSTTFSPTASRMFDIRSDPGDENETKTTKNNSNNKCIRRLKSC